MTRLGGGLKILVIGKDARTDAIAAACRDSALRVELYAAAEMLIPGLVEKCVRVFIGDLTDTKFLRDLVSELQPDLVIVGPEEPLAAGFVDVLEDMGIAAFGPSMELAQIESSKSWTRKLLEEYDIPGNPEHRLIREPGDLRPYMEELGEFVVKPDGLTAGKGVKVFGEHLHSIDEALAYAEDLIAKDTQVQIEERLEGEEFSLQTITDGTTWVHCPPIQDHKRAYKGDSGPNTGGMGSYSSEDHSLPFLRNEDIKAARRINERVIEALGRKCGKAYKGVLYGGFMAVRDGVRVVEYNARFGDPEAMNVLPLLQGDFAEVAVAVANGTLSEVECSFAAKATVCKYIVPKLYPQKGRAGGEITVPENLRDRTDLKWFWAACAQTDSGVELTGSRAGAFVAIADSLAEAEKKAEQAARAVGGDVRHRDDIGRVDVIEKRQAHMRALRAAVPA